MSSIFYTAEKMLFQANCISLMEGLLKSHTGKVKLIYLDPPRASSTPEAGLRKYLDLVSKVIQLSRELLCPDGGLVFHTNPFVTSTVRLLLDHFFGVDNFREEFIWAINKFSKTGHDILWFYSKSSNYTYSPPFKLIEEKEGDSRRLDRLSSLITRSERPAFQFEWRSFSPPSGYSWRMSRESLDKLEEEGLIIFPSSGGMPKQKSFTGNLEVEIGSIWDDIPQIVANSQEYIGFKDQKPLALLDRIILLGTESRDLFLDPFCGSGTGLIAAQKFGRFWIGGDTSPEAVSTCVERLNAIGLKPGTDFLMGKEKELLENRYAEVNYSDLLSENQILSFQLQESGIRPKAIHNQVNEFQVKDCKDRLEAFVITEGKTDWKHLKAALADRNLAGKFKNLWLDFLEYEDEQDFKMGNDQLLKLCIRLSKIPQTRPTILIFDRDEEMYVKKASEAGRDYRRWGNNVYSMVLPVPKHRERTPDVCIELYYSDNVLMRRDSKNRRIYLNKEFLGKSGAHKTRVLFCRDNAVFESKLSVIDKEVYNRKGENVALSKNDFAEYVLNKDSEFTDMRFSCFDPIFLLIEEIIKESSA